MIYFFVVVETKYNKTPYLIEFENSGQDQLNEILKGHEDVIDVWGKQISKGDYDSISSMSFDEQLALYNSFIERQKEEERAKMVTNYGKKRAGYTRQPIDKKVSKRRRKAKAAKAAKRMQRRK